MEDEFIKHAASGLVLTASRTGAVTLAPRGELTRTQGRGDRGLILDNTLGLVQKLTAIYDTVKVESNRTHQERPDHFLFIVTFRTSRSMPSSGG